MGKFLSGKAPGSCVVVCLYYRQELARSFQFLDSNNTVHFYLCIALETPFLMLNGEFAHESFNSGLGKVKALIKNDF